MTLRIHSRRSGKAQVQILGLLQYYNEKFYGEKIEIVITDCEQIKQLKQRVRELEESRFAKIDKLEESEAFWEKSFKQQLSANIKMGERVNRLEQAKRELVEAMDKAVEYLRQGKAKFVPHTTNSFVDEFIEKWEAKIKSEGRDVKRTQF